MIARSLAGPEVVRKSSAPGLRVSSPADGFEREADKVADRILAMPDPAAPAIGIQHAPQQLQRCPGGCNCSEEIHRQPEDDEDELQRSPAGVSTGPVTAADVHSMGSGTPLPAATRSFFEPRFGTDLSQVRIHTSERAGDLAHTVGAKAFTYHQDIAFAPGRYQPATTAGRHLLAHELTHTTQQKHGSVGISRAIVYGSGYARPAAYRPDENEIRQIEAGTWSPHSLDFREGARRSGGGAGRRTFRGLLNWLRAQQPGSVDRLGVIGHAFQQGLGLSGTVHPPPVMMAANGLLNGASLAANAARVAAVRNRFSAGGYITLFGCNAGANQGLLDAISNTFGIRVNGFADPLYFCMTWRARRPRRLNRRGRLDYVPPLEFDLDNPLPPAQRDPCTQSAASVWQLNPDRTSNAGVPAQQGAAP